MKKKLVGSLVASCMMFGIGITAMAADSIDTLAWDDFDAYLPANRGDVEVSEVAKGDSPNDYFYVDFTQYTTGLDAVCAWTEGVAGNNLSDPANQVSISGGSVDYYSVPAEGTNVTLNLDNPVTESSTPHVVGDWTPY